MVATQGLGQQCPRLPPLLVYEQPQQQSAVQLEASSGGVARRLRRSWRPQRLGGCQVFRRRRRRRSSVWPWRPRLQCPCLSRRPRHWPLEPFHGQEPHGSAWKFRFTNVMGLFGLNNLLSMAEPEAVFTKAGLGPDLQQKSEMLWALLAQLCHGRAFALVRLSERNHGFAAWRRLHEEYDLPQQMSRHLSVRCFSRPFLLLLMRLPTHFWNGSGAAGTLSLARAVACQSWCSAL